MKRLAGMVLWIALLGQAAAAVADTFVPTRFDDPPPGNCKPDNCSLREAITKANKLDGADKVVLGAGTYKMELPDDGGDDNGDGDFDVIGEATIVGRGASKTTVDGQGIATVFQLLTFPPHAIKGLTVKGGNTVGKGGGIFIGPSEATIKNVVVRSNTALDGGGISSVSTDLRISKTTIRDNTATGRGGGLFLQAGVYPHGGVVRETTINGNHAVTGGGIANDGTNFSIFDEEGVLELLNSTVTSNDASANGGGISTVGGATTTLDNTTVAYNLADSNNSGGGAGGGVRQSAATFEIADSIVAANVLGTTGSDAQCSGSFTGSYNVLTTPAGCASFPSGPNQVVSNAMIGPLANNGGPTKTAALLAGSPAIGLAGGCPPRDQRGVERPDNCDSGAYERTSADP